jgi:four helix bundle protein
MLDHEKLDVYQCAIQFVAIAVPVAAALPRGHAALADQLRRAAISIPLNIAQGCGKVAGVDRAKFYAIARGSAMECSAVVDVVRLLETRRETELSTAKAMLERVVAMLSKMCR